jgi:hypothetical protein
MKFKISVWQQEKSYFGVFLILKFLVIKREVKDSETQANNYCSK